MKTTVFFFFALIHLTGFGQGLGRGVDSVANRKWIVTPWRTISGEDCLQKIESVYRTKDRLVIMNCDTSAEITYYIWGIPETCKDSYKRYKAAPDSKKADELYSTCVENYYNDPVNSDKTDTLFMEENSPAVDELGSGFGKNLYITSEIIYDSKGTFMFGVFYYTIDELKNSCIKANLRKKRMESWQNGLKHGDWVFYDLTGAIICEEKYEDGILIKSSCK